MEPEKRQTARKHFLLLIIGLLGLLALLSIFVPSRSEAPEMPRDENHRYGMAARQCMACHVSNDSTAARMPHPAYRDCTRCHVRK